jgi:Nitrile hydratase, alpha chain
MSDHDHDEDSHDHGHDDHHEELVIEDEAGNIEGQILADALQNVLVRQNLIAPGEVRREIEKIESPGVHLGAKIVARAWTDDGYKARLLADGKSAAAELGITVGEAQLIVVENTEDTHNLVCCTLCSCYPRSILGQPPAWYISKAYRARAVREPRMVLAEFGLEIPDDTKLRVHDSNADMRYLVLPVKPDGSENLNEEELAALVTRDCMIGTATALLP